MINVLENANIVMTAYFCLEMLIKVVALSFLVYGALSSSALRNFGKGGGGG